MKRRSEGIRKNRLCLEKAGQERKHNCLRERAPDTWLGESPKDCEERSEEKDFGRGEGVPRERGGGLDVGRKTRSAGSKRRKGVETYTRDQLNIPPPSPENGGLVGTGGKGKTSGYDASTIRRNGRSLEAVNQPKN